MSISANVYFFTSMFPVELEDEIYDNSIGAVANANNTLQWNLFKGLKFFHNSIFILNFPNVGSYPFKYKKVFVPSVYMYIDNELIGESVSFFNLVYIKHFFKYKKIKILLNQLLSKSLDGEKFIFYIYDMYPPFLKAISDFKKDNLDKEIYICLIVPDLIGKTGLKDDIFHKFALNIDKKIIFKSIESVDSFVLLSDQMRELLPIGNKKSVIVEGIFNDAAKKHDLEKSTIKTLFYSGALDERNGVLNLLQAFSNISNENYRLCLCGDGPLREYIVSLAKVDKRVEYKGQLRREVVLDLQRRATLLINPRLPGQDFTKYSFPSKTMEYFASGVPVLMYKLEGIPEEYFDYCFSLADISVEALTEKILVICNMDVKLLKNLACDAQKFILSNKNARSQCGKIYNMVTGL